MSRIKKCTARTVVVCLLNLVYVFFHHLAVLHQEEGFLVFTSDLHGDGILCPVVYRSTALGLRLIGNLLLGGF